MRTQSRELYLTLQILVLVVAQQQVMVSPAEVVRLEAKDDEVLMEQENFVEVALLYVHQNCPYFDNLESMDVDVEMRLKLHCRQLHGFDANNIQLH
jgi:hypothetical protein